MSTPKPLNAVNALRLHLKQLERGVNEARTRRLGPTSVSTPTPSLGSSTSYGNATANVTRSPSAPFNAPPPMSRQPTSYPLQSPPPAASQTVSSKPKAKPKNGADFSAFFQDIDKREAS